VSVKNQASDWQRGQRGALSNVRSASRVQTTAMQSLIVLLMLLCVVLNADNIYYYGDEAALTCRVGSSHGSVSCSWMTAASLLPAANKNLSSLPMKHTFITWPLHNFCWRCSG